METATRIQQEKNKHSGPRARLFDLRFGYALLWDARVPLFPKLLAFGIGVVLTAVIEFAEVPIEEITAFLVPLLGGLAGVALDGAEAIAGPFLLGLLLLPYLAPSSVVDRIRRERTSPTGEKEGPIIDV